jgi:tetratricopeptide (TPR) repeat protein
VKGRRVRATLVAAALLAAGCAHAPVRPTDALSAEEHNTLGVAYHRQGAYEAAAREFRQALVRDPGLVRALVNLGDTQVALGTLDVAIETYERARALSPDDPALANNLAWALLQHDRRWPEAEPLIRGALARDPEPRGYYLDTLGLLLLRQAEPGAALAAFRAALADRGLRDPEARRLVLRHAGDALRRLGEGEAADRCERLAEVGGSESVC